MLSWLQNRGNMLTAETKRHIDAARQVLVGKVPDPKQQIDQITNALIYKFMNDMDIKSKDSGGKASFFTGELEKYAWTKLMDPRKGSQDRLNLYTEGLEKFSTAAQLPQLFRDIFRQAFLPYRDPETLNLFLKEIEYFDYNHSEELGNAFEYLLSIMGSQGDAGQFRTPRHIIEFIVDILDPGVDDTILDPACGTAGFLISAYKHIVEKHDGKDEEGKSNEEKKLTHAQHQKLLDNMVGYDISSDMVKLARVNMYLHGNRSPQIYEYDTLSSEERWGDNFDVIMANPPFMSPKGGIRPHNKFGVESSRAEVLFVDYIMSHLKQSGRAGIIVPEGIIFQSGKSYKQLRKSLVEDGLLAVISLPAGVFNPYAGVKTSILIFDNNRAKKSKDIIFAKVNHDGFDLGAQRRKIGKDDLPLIAAILRTYRVDPSTDIDQIKSELAKSDFFTVGVSAIGGPDKIGSLEEVGQVEITAVSKEKIAENGDYNLTASRYLVTEANQNQKWPMIRLGDLIKQDFGVRITKRESEGTKYPVYGGGGKSFYTDNFNRKDDLVISRFAMSENCVRRVEGKFYLLDSGFTYHIKENYAAEVLKEYIDNILLNIQDKIYVCARGHAQKNIDNAQLNNIEIPVPPIEVQKEIVAELDGYQKIIDGARQVIENYKPIIKIDPKWPMVKVGDVCAELFAGGDVPKDYSKEKTAAFNVPIFTNGLGSKSLYGFTDKARVTAASVTISARGTIGYPELRIDPFYPAIRLIVAVPNTEVVDVRFFKYVLGTKEISRTGNSIPQLTVPMVKEELIQLPPIEEQKRLARMLDEEAELVMANNELIKKYEQKIKHKTAEVWS